MMAGGNEKIINYRNKNITAFQATIRVGGCNNDSK